MISGMAAPIKSIQFYMVLLKSSTIWLHCTAPWVIASNEIIFRVVVPLKAVWRLRFSMGFIVLCGQSHAVSSCSSCSNVCPKKPLQAPLTTHDLCCWVAECKDVGRHRWSYSPAHLPHLGRKLWGHPQELLTMPGALQKFAAANSNQHVVAALSAFCKCIFTLDCCCCCCCCCCSLMGESLARFFDVWLKSVSMFQLILTINCIFLLFQWKIGRIAYSVVKVAGKLHCTCKIKLSSYAPSQHLLLISNVHLQFCLISYCQVPTLTWITREKPSRISAWNEVQSRSATASLLIECE